MYVVLGWITTGDANITVCQPAPVSPVNAAFASNCPFVA